MYQNIFYILPKETLINTCHVSNTSNSGKFNIGIAPYDYGKHH